MSDIIAEFGTKNLNQIKWYHNRGPHDYMRPAWVFEESLFVWCDEHSRWNEHGTIEGEEIPGRITCRCPHHHDCDGDVYYCMGPADRELAKILTKYPQEKATHTAPPIRRVYPGELKTTDNFINLCPMSATKYLRLDVYGGKKQVTA
jgi:hypothetical protein